MFRYWICLLCDSWRRKWVCPWSNLIATNQPPPRPLSATLQKARLSLGWRLFKSLWQLRVPLLRAMDYSARTAKEKQCTDLYSATVYLCGVSSCDCLSPKSSELWQRGIETIFLLGQWCAIEIPCNIICSFCDIIVDKGSEDKIDRCMATLPTECWYSLIVSLYFVIRWMYLIVTLYFILSDAFYQMEVFDCNREQQVT